MSAKLYTIGYEGMTLDCFVERLKRYAIDCLIDVRDLGSPKPIRNRLKENSSLKK